MQEIKDILHKHNIAGAIVLHTPGHSEYLLRIDPSYSCAKFQGEELRVKAKLQEDFNGNKEAQQRKVADTSNMLRLMAETTGNISLSLFEISSRVDQAVDADHHSGGHTSHTTQNN